MTRRTLTCVLGLFLASTSCGGSDETKPVDAAIDTRGSGGRGGAGGAGGSGGRGVDAAPDIIPAIDVSTADTSADGSDGGSDLGTSDTSGSDGGGGDARDTNTTPDAPVTIDTAPDVTTPVETAPVTVTACNQIACPDLMNLVTTCNGSGSACTAAMSVAGQVTTTNYCHANGVKKTATYNDTTKLISMRVKRPNGTDCYTLDMTPGANSMSENWTYKLPGGTVLGTAVAQNPPGSLITLKCSGNTYVIDTAQVDCAGTDGQPGPGECANGACTP
jgi:hypothetical protein